MEVLIKMDTYIKYESNPESGVTIAYFTTKTTLNGRPLFINGLNIIFDKEMDKITAGLDESRYICSNNTTQFVKRFVKRYGFPMGIAKCAPNDTFDKDKGIDIARKRLIISEARLMRQFYIELHKAVMHHMVNISHKIEKYINRTEYLYKDYHSKFG